MSDQAVTLAEFNLAENARVREILGAVLDVPEYADEVDRGRPYPDLAALVRASADAADRIGWPQVAAALARHPRIGERSAPAAATGAEAAWSAAEQAGVRDDEVDDFAVGNAAYEDRFGFIFLICAAGLSGEQMLASLRERLGHTVEEEQPLVIAELRKIAALRLRKAVQA